MAQPLLHQLTRHVRRAFDWMKLRVTPSGRARLRAVDREIARAGFIKGVVLASGEPTVAVAPDVPDLDRDVVREVGRELESEAPEVGRGLDPEEPELDPEEADSSRPGSAPLTPGSGRHAEGALEPEGLDRHATVGRHRLHDAELKVNVVPLFSFPLGLALNFMHFLARDGQHLTPSQLDLLQKVERALDLEPERVTLLRMRNRLAEEASSDAEAIVVMFDRAMEPPLARRATATDDLGANLDAGVAR